MRDIAFLAHRLPYPPDRGDRIRSWHVLNALAELAPVHVFAMIDDAKDQVHVAAVRNVAATVTIVRRQKSKIAAIGQALLTGQPASVLAFMNEDLRAAISATLPRVSTVYAFSSQMAAYVPESFNGRFVMDFVDLDSAKFEMMGFAGRQEAKRLLAWETTTAKRADVSLFVSDDEAAQFTEKTGLAAHVMGNGIDLAHFAPDVVASAETSAPLIVFTGQMDYAPNVEAVSAFANDILPIILKVVPGATFAIVGRAPTKAVRSLVGPRVIVTGEVPDTRPWLAAAAVVVAPLRIARGVQNKVLEAMAMGRACVVSSGAARGVDARDGHELIISDDPAGDVIALLKDPALSASIGTNARANMVAHYGWKTRLARLPEFVGQ